MSTKPNIPALAADELERFTIAEQIGRLRSDPGFARLRRMLQQAVDAALAQIVQNANPRADALLSTVYRERLRMVKAIDDYLEMVVSDRRESIKALLLSLGIEEELAERNQDISLDFLIKSEAPHNGSK